MHSYVSNEPILWLSDFFSDCPKCWKNFVIDFNPDRYIDENIFQEKLRENNIVYYGRYKLANIKDQSKNRMIAKFASTGDLLQFRIKWG